MVQVQQVVLQTSESGELLAPLQRVSRFSGGVYLKYAIVYQ